MKKRTRQTGKEKCLPGGCDESLLFSVKEKVCVPLRPGIASWVPGSWLVQFLCSYKEKCPGPQRASRRISLNARCEALAIAQQR